MRTQKISVAIIRSKIRPEGYIEDLKAHSEKWDELSDTYQITQENWDKLCNKYRQEDNRRPDKCMHASCLGCSGGIMCGNNPGMDCSDPYNQECKFRGN